MAYLELGDCRSVVPREPQILDFLFQILLMFIPATASPKDARSGISSLPQQAHRHAGQPPSSPFTVYESHCPTPSREQVPICPGPTCFSSLLPMARLPCFLLLAWQKDACHYAVQPQGPSQTQSTCALRH